MKGKLAFVFAFLAFDTVAGAQQQFGGQPPPPPPQSYSPEYGYRAPGAYVHDGFYLRLNAGIGGTVFQASDVDLKVSGVGGMLSIAAGGAIAPNLILYGEFLADISGNPDVKLGNTSFNTDGISAGVIGLGGGVAYYFMPVNIYISATVSAARLSVSDSDGEIAHSPWGIGGSVMVGKEWWVSDNWGLGVALHLYGGRINDTVMDTDVTWSFGAIALAFSATYN
jgi:hypothetical protein